jgi:hypothetical protein
MTITKIETVTLNGKYLGQLLHHEDGGVDFIASKQSKLDSFKTDTKMNFELLVKEQIKPMLRLIVFFVIEKEVVFKFEFEYETMDYFITDNTEIKTYG